MWFRADLTDPRRRHVSPLYRFVVHKHLHGFVQDDDSAGKLGAGNEAQRRGNLDIVGLQFDGKQRGRQLPPGAVAQARTLMHPEVKLVCTSSCA